MMQPDLIEALMPVVRALERLEAPYFVTGAVAAAAYGTRRTTLDVDLVAELADRQAGPLTEALRATYYVDEGMIRDAVRRGASFNLVHLGNLVKLDVYVRKPSPYHTETFRRRREVSVETGGAAARFVIASPEDVVLNKLRWYRAGSGVAQRQWQDVVEVLCVQGETLDAAYMQRWATDLGVTDLLAKAINEAKELEGEP